MFDVIDVLSIMRPLVLGAALLAVIKLLLRTDKETAASNILLVVLILCVSRLLWNQFVREILGNELLVLGGPIAACMPWLPAPLIYCYIHIRLYPPVPPARYLWHVMPFLTAVIITTLGLVDTFKEWKMIVIAWFVWAVSYVVATGGLIYSVKTNRDNNDSRGLAPAAKQVLALLIGFGVVTLVDTTAGIRNLFFVESKEMIDIHQLTLFLHITLISVLVVYLAYIDLPSVARTPGSDEGARRPRGRTGLTRLPDSAARALSDELESVLKRDERFTDPGITLADLSRELKVTRHVLSDLLNNHMRTSFFDYINGLRVGKAGAMLRDTRKPITDIAVACGFNSRTTLYSAFKKRYGMTPARFRRDGGPAENAAVL